MKETGTDTTILCPYESGPSVFGARELLSMVDTTEYSYENVCDAFSGRLMQFAIETKSKGKIGTNTTELWIANGELHFLNKEHKIVEIYMYDLTGKILLKEVKLKSSNHTINIDTFPKGIYLLSITDDQNNITFKKIVL